MDAFSFPTWPLPLNYHQVKLILYRFHCFAQSPMFFLLFATNQLEPDFTVLDPLNLGFFHSLCNIGRLAWLAGFFPSPDWTKRNSSLLFFLLALDYWFSYLSSWMKPFFLDFTLELFMSLPPNLYDLWATELVPSLSLWNSTVNNDSSLSVYSHFLVDVITLEGKKGMDLFVLWSVTWFHCQLLCWLAMTSLLGVKIE